MARIKSGLCLIFLTLASLVMSVSDQRVAADGESFSPSYQVVKDGSDGISVADQYFVKPGKAEAVGDHYEVILTVRTDHSLGIFPVTIEDINGQAPIVSKTTQGNTDFYQFKFTTNNLSQRITGHMTVNIPAIRYDHYYGFGVLFDTNGIPAIGSNSENSGNAGSSNQSTTGQEVSGNPNGQSTQNSSQTQQSSTTITPGAPNPSSVPKPQVTPKAAIKKDKKDKAAGKPLPWWPFAVVVATAVVIGIVSEWRARRNSKKSQE